MTALTQPLPFESYRSRVDDYVGHLALPYASEAGAIIAAALRLPRPRGVAAFAIWASAAVGGDPEHAVPIAAAIALFACSNALRADAVARRLPSGLGQGINAGDALNAVAYRMLLLGDAPLARRLQASRVVTASFIEAIERRNDAVAWAGIEAGALIGGASAARARQLRRAGRWLAAASGAHADEYAERAIAAVAASGIDPAHVRTFCAGIGDFVARG